MSGGGGLAYAQKVCVCGGGEVGRSYAEIVEGEGMGRGADAWRRE